jgi:type IX secretion system PorP/SprF family membrane protein
VNKKFYLKGLPILLLFVVLSSASGQDIHYSQIGNSPTNMNPGLIGVFDGNHRFIANFRDQWRSVPVPYLQLAAGYDHRFSDKKERLLPFAVGLNLNYDKAGDLGLSWTNIGLGGSYALRLLKDKHHFLSFGINGSANNRRFDPSQATFDAEYDIKEGRPAIITPSETFENTSRWFADLGGGVNLRLQKDSSRTHFDVGAGMFHFFEPNVSFENNPAVELNRRINFHGNGTIEVADKFDLLLFAMAQFQGNYDEIVIGAGGLIHLNTRKARKFALQLGGVYRLQDAIAPWVGLRFTAWQFHLSYDVNISDFTRATNGFGGPEITVIHIIKNVPPMDYCKLCPKYM